jgi:hypothetical protein
MSSPRDRLSPGQPESAPGPRGSKASRAPTTRCAMPDEGLSCLGVSERVLVCLCQVLDRWHPTSSDGQRPSLASCLIIPLAPMTSGGVEPCCIAGTEDQDHHRRRTHAVVGVAMPGRRAWGSGRDDPAHHRAVLCKTWGNPRRWSRGASRVLAPHGQGQGAGPPLPLRAAMIARFACAGASGRGEKSDKHKVPDTCASSPSRGTLPWTTRPCLPSGRPLTRPVCAWSTIASRRALHARRCLSASRHIVGRIGRCSQWHTRACAVLVPCAPARHLPAHEEPTRVTSDDDTPQWIGWPGGLSLLGLACLWHRWPPWCEQCARHPSLSLTPFLPHNRLARTCSNTISSAAPREDSSWGRMT